MRGKTGVIVFLLVFASIVCSCAASKPSNNVESFSLSDYEDDVLLFPSNLTVGMIEHGESAKYHAENIWTTLYGESIQHEKPFHVYWDENSSTWLVVSSPQKNWFGSVKGGSAYILFKQEDGKVLAVWHEE